MAFVTPRINVDINENHLVHYLKTFTSNALHFHRRLAPDSALRSQGQVERYFSPLTTGATRVQRNVGRDNLFYSFCSDLSLGWLKG